LAEIYERLSDFYHKKSNLLRWLFIFIVGERVPFLFHSNNSNNDDGGGSELGKGPGNQY